MDETQKIKTKEEEFKTTLNLITICTNQQAQNAIPKLLPKVLLEIGECPNTLLPTLLRIINQTLIRAKNLVNLSIPITNLLKISLDYPECTEGSMILFRNLLFTFLDLALKTAEDEDLKASSLYIFSNYSKFNINFRYCYLIYLFRLLIRLSSDSKKIVSTIESQATFNTDTLEASKSLFIIDCCELFLIQNNLTNVQILPKGLSIPHWKQWSSQLKALNVNETLFSNVKSQAINFLSHFKNQELAYVPLVIASRKNTDSLNNPAESALSPILASLNCESYRLASFIYIFLVPQSSNSGLSLSSNNHKDSLKETFSSLFISNLSTTYSANRSIVDSDIYLQLVNTLSKNPHCYSEQSINMTFHICFQALNTKSDLNYQVAGLQILEAVVNCAEQKLLYPFTKAILDNLKINFFDAMERTIYDNPNFLKVFQIFKSLLLKIDFLENTSTKNFTSTTVSQLIEISYRLFQSLNVSPRFQNSYRGSTSNLLMALSTIRSCFTRNNFLFHTALQKFKSNVSQEISKESSLFSENIELKHDVSKLLIKLLDSLFTPNFNQYVHLEALSWATDIFPEDHPANKYYIFICIGSNINEISSLATNIIQRQTTPKNPQLFQLLMNFFSERETHIKSDITSPNLCLDSSLTSDITSIPSFENRIKSTPTLVTYLTKCLALSKMKFERDLRFLDDNKYNFFNFLSYIHPLLLSSDNEQSNDDKYEDKQVYIIALEELFSLSSTLKTLNPNFCRNMISYICSNLHKIINIFYNVQKLNAPGYLNFINKLTKLVGQLNECCEYYSPTNQTKIWTDKISSALSKCLTPPYINIGPTQFSTNLIGSIMALSAFLGNTTLSLSKEFSEIQQFLLDNLLCTIRTFDNYSTDSTEFSSSYSSSYQRLYSNQLAFYNHLSEKTIISLYRNNRHHIIFSCCQCIIRAYASPSQQTKIFTSDPILITCITKGNLIQLLWQVANSILDEFLAKVDDDFKLPILCSIWNSIGCLYPLDSIKEHASKLLSLGKHHHDALQCNIGLSFSHLISLIYNSNDESTSNILIIVELLLNHFSSKLTTSTTTEPHDFNATTEKPIKLNNKLELPPQSICIWLSCILTHHPMINFGPDVLAKMQNVFLKCIGSHTLLVAEASWKGLSRIHYNYICSSTTIESYSDVLYNPSQLNWELLKTAIFTFVKKSHGGISYSEYLEKQKNNASERVMIMDSISDAGAATRNLNSLRYYADICKHFQHWPLFLALIDQPKSTVFSQDIYNQCLNLEEPSFINNQNILLTLCPKKLWKPLFVYIFHPNRNISQAVFSLLKALLNLSTVPDIIEALQNINIGKSLIEFFTSGLDSPDSYIREASCTGLPLIITNLSYEKVESSISSLLKSTLRVMDDIEESVSTSAILLGNAIKSLIVRFSSSNDDNICKATLEASLPLLQNHFQVNNNTMLRHFCIGLIRECTEAAKSKIEPFIPQLIPFLIESISPLEPDLNQFQYHSEALLGMTSAQLDERRYSITKISSQMNFIHYLVTYLSPDTTSKLATSLIRISKSGLGISTRASCLQFITWTALERGTSTLEPNTAFKILKGIMPCLFDYSDLTRNMASSSFSALFPLCEPSLVSSLICNELLIRPPEAAVDQKARDKQRTLIGKALFDLARQASESLKLHNVERKLFSMSYLLSFSLNSEVSKNWKSILDEMAFIKHTSLITNLTFVCEECILDISSTSREDKIAVARAIYDVCNTLSSNSNLVLESLDIHQKSSLTNLFNSFLKNIQSHPPFPGISELLKSLLQLFSIISKLSDQELITNPLSCVLTMCSKSPMVDQSQILSILDIYISSLSNQHLLNLDYSIFKTSLEGILSRSLISDSSLKGESILLELIQLSTLSVWLSLIRKEKLSYNECTLAFFNYDYFLKTLANIPISSSNEVKKLQIFERFISLLTKDEITLSSLIEKESLLKLIELLLQAIQTRKPKRRFSASLEIVMALISHDEIVPTNLKPMQLAFYKLCFSCLQPKLLIPIDLEGLLKNHNFLNSSLFSLLYICLFLAYSTPERTEESTSDSSPSAALKLIDSSLLKIISHHNENSY